MADLSTLTIITNKQPEQFFNNKTNHEIDQSLDSLIEILNDVDETRKDKIKALVVLSNLARVENRRDDVLDAIRQLNENFENALIEREEGAETFSKKTKVDDMHQLVILLFIRLMDYRFTTADLLDLLRYKHNLALATIEISLKKVAYEDDVCLGLTRLFSGFAIPSTYFAGKGKQTMSERDCSEFSDKINLLVDKFRGSPIITTWVDAVIKRALKKSKGDIHQVHFEMMNHGLNAFTNTYNFTTGNGATGFRQHLLVSEKIPTKLLLPILKAIITKYDNNMDDEKNKKISPTTMATIKTILKSFILITFEMFSQTNKFRLKNNITMDLLNNKKIQQCMMEEDSSIFALVLLYNVNIDSMENMENDDEKQQDIDKISQCINEFWMRLKDKERVKRLFTTPGSLPISRQIFTYRYIYDMLGCKEDDDEEYDIEENAEEIIKKNDGDVKEEEGKKQENFRLLGNLPEMNKTTNNSRHSNNNNKSGWKVRNNNGYHNRRKKKEKKKKKKKKKERNNNINEGSKTEDADQYPIATPVILGLPSEFLCAMNGQCLKEPMRSKINPTIVFEKRTIEGWFERCGHVCPITSTPLKPSDIEYDDNLAKQITSFMIQQSYQSNNNNFADEDDMYSF